MLILDDDVYTEFANSLRLDEERYVLVTAEIDFFEKVQTDVNG